MSNYYSNSIDYHNDLDAFEARVRAEQAERDAEEETCTCFEIQGDNADCPKHGDHFKSHGPIVELSDAEQVMADYFDDYGANYHERNDMYLTGMGC